MRNSTFLLLLLCVLSSCGGDDFDVLSDVRLYSSGVIKDTQGAPVQGIDIAIADGSRILGRSETDVAGFYEFVAVKSNALVFDVQVNLNSNEDLTGIIYRSFNTEINDLSLGDVTLKRTGNLDFNILKSSTTTDDLIYSITYIEPGQGRVCTEILTGNDPNPNPNPTTSICESTVFIEDQITTNGTASARRNIVSLVGETVVFNYTLGNNPPVTVEIPLINTQNTYEFQY